MKAVLRLTRAFPVLRPTDTAHLFYLADDVLREEREQHAAKAARHEDDEWFSGNGASVNV